MILNFIKVHPDALVPTRMTTESAGYDLAITEDVVFEEGDTSVKICGTGIAVQLDCENEERETFLSHNMVLNHYALMLYARSSLCKTGLLLANGVGVIDTDYRGEIKVPLINVSGKRVELKAGTRVAQLVIQNIVIPKTNEVSSLEATERGTGGFGSTGV